MTFIKIKGLIVIKRFTILTPVVVTLYVVPLASHTEGGERRWESGRDVGSQGEALGIRQASRKAAEVAIETLY
jgi:hypothetical protein